MLLLQVRLETQTLVALPPNQIASLLGPCLHRISALPLHSPKNVLLPPFISGRQAPRCCLCLLSNPLTFITTTSIVFYRGGAPHQNHRKQCGNQRGGIVWAVSLQLLLMSCNLQQQEAMPARGNCCCAVRSFANRGGGIRSSVLISRRTKGAEGGGVRNDLL